MPTPTATIFLPYSALDEVIQRGTRAAQPPASAVVPGTLYCVTDEGNALERSDGVSWAAYAPTSGGAPAAHHATHEPGGTDALVDAAWTDQSNTFVGDQTVDGDLFVTGTVDPLTAERRDQINQLIGDPTGSRMLMSSSYVSGLSLRHDEDLNLGKIACGNYDAQTYQPIATEVASLQVRTGTTPATLAEHLRVHPSGGVTVGVSPDHDADPGVGIVRARGYDFPEGVPANPAVDTLRVYAIDFQGFTFLETRDSAGRTLRTGRDMVGVGKVSEAGGIAKGQAVYISGGTGSIRLLSLARADDRATLPVYGLALDAGAQNAFIRVLTEGVVFGMDTSGIPEGTRLYASPTTAGALTTTPPVAPQFIQRIGQVLRSHGVNGEIAVSLSSALSEAAREAVHASMHAPGGRDALTALDAGVLTSGTLPDARLSANVAMRNVANTFTGDQTISKDTPQLHLYDASQSANARRFAILNYGQLLWLQALSDDASTSSGVVQINRGGDVFLRNVYEQDHQTPMGHWMDVPYSAGNFTANGGMTWNVSAGNVIFNRYTVIGKTLIWLVYIEGASLSGTAGSQLYLALPSGCVGVYRRGVSPTTQLYDGGYHRGWVRVNTNNTSVILEQDPPAAYALNSGVTYVEFSISLEIN
jgi:hypothetical protein